MTRALTYVEIDVPAWTQTSPDSPETEVTLRFAIDTDYLPNSIPAIASIKDIVISPATISLGTNLGERATVTVTFRDHRHIFDGEDFNSGTFWGKFRARYGLTLQGNPFRLIRGTLGQSLEEMETRHFIVDSTQGPTNEGDYQIIAKDIFTFVTGDKAQAPRLSNGRLSTSITNVASSVALTPTGIVADEYSDTLTGSPPTAYLAIGGSEIVLYGLLGGDSIGISRGQFNTTAVAHNADERAQLCLYYEDDDPADIIYDLLVNYANIDPDFITLSDWQAETAAQLGTTYTALIADPKPVDQLISELIEQASLAMWWDDVQQKIRLQVLQPIPATIGTFDETNTLRGTLEVNEQPEKRLSEVQVYFHKLNPLIQDDELNNYVRTARTEDETAIAEYGSAAIKQIFSRWIPNAGASTAQTLSNKQLGRFRDPPRTVKFHVMRDQPSDPQLGGGYQLGGAPFQTMTGAVDLIPIQITRLNPLADHFEIEAEEMLWTPFGADINPTIRNITFSSNRLDVNLRDVHDDTYGAPVSGDTVNFIVQSGIILGASSTVTVGCDVGTWPAGVTVNLTVNGRIQGAGARGGAGGGGQAGNLSDGENGSIGGTALYTRQAINLTSTNGQIWAGGGGGGGGGAFSIGSAAYGGGGAGGGAGTAIATGGSAGFGLLGGNAQPGEDSTSEAGGAGGAGYGGTINQGGAGGGPGLAGAAGATTGSGGGVIASNAGSGGAGGKAIDGDSFVTDIGAVGDIRGAQVN